MSTTHNRPKKGAEQTESSERTAKSERLAARLSPEQKAVVERAAALAHQPVSQFVIASAMRAAEETIQQHDLIVLSARDSAAIMQALLHPEPAGPALKSLVERYEAFMKQ